MSLLPGSITVSGVQIRCHISKSIEHKKGSSREDSKMPTGEEDCLPFSNLAIIGSGSALARLAFQIAVSIFHLSHVFSHQFLNSHHRFQALYLIVFRFQSRLEFAQQSSDILPSSLDHAAGLEPGWLLTSSIISIKNC